VYTRAAPSQHGAAPTTVMLIGRASIRASVQRMHPWETERRREIASGCANGEDGGAVNNQPYYHSNVPHNHIYAMVIRSMPTWLVSQGYVPPRDLSQRRSGGQSATLLTQ
jgi:hypothetical protein